MVDLLRTTMHEPLPGSGDHGNSTHGDPASERSLSPITDGFAGPLLDAHEDVLFDERGRFRRWNRTVVE